MWYFRSAPYHPATNGLVERFNRTIKQAVKTSVKSGKTVQEAIQEFLLIYRATPHSVTDASPSSLFLGRTVKTRLDLLRPDLRGEVQKKQMDQKRFHDTKRTRLGSFEVGQEVWVRDYREGSARWSEGKVLEVLGSRTYLVELDGGVIVRRHSNQLQDRCGKDVQDEQETRRVTPNFEWYDSGEDRDSDSTLGKAESQSSQPSPPTGTPTTTQPTDSTTADNVGNGESPSDTTESVRRYPIRNRRPVQKPGFVSY